jgi:hypothetical protein
LPLEQLGHLSSAFLSRERKVEETSARHFVIDACVFSHDAASAKATLAALLPVGRPVDVASGASRSMASFPLDSDKRINRHFSFNLSLL